MWEISVVPGTKTLELFMHARLAMRSVLILTVAVSVASNAQHTPLDTSVDTRSIAMGESFVATRGTLSGVIYNPANLAALKGVHVAYAQRKVNWFSPLDDFRFHQITGTMRAPFAVIGVSYNRYQMGEFIVTGPSGPTPIARARPYEHVIGLTFARSFDCGIDAGISAKMFDIVDLPTAVTTPMFLVDAGFTYSFLGCDSATSTTAITFGLSIQNFGTYFKTMGGQFNIASLDRPPRFLRLGVSFSNEAPGNSPLALKPFGILFTTEVRWLMNEPTLVPNQVTAAGFGLEVSVFEIVSLRGGGYFPPTTDVYGKVGSFTARFGGGINIPLRKIGVDTPLRASFEYGVIRLNADITGPRGFNTGISSLSTFAFTLNYQNDIF